MTESDQTIEDRALRVTYLGPPGSFGEQALRTIDELRGAQALPARTMPEALQAVAAGEVDLALVAIENSIEGTVNVSLDTLIFDTDLLIQQEVVIEVELALLAPRGVKAKDLKRIVSFPVAAAECREYLSEKHPAAEIIAANSTSDAVRQVSRTASLHTGAIGTKLAAKLYNMDVLAGDISDHPGNQTRFLLVAKSGIPAPTGHDRTSIVLFQSDNKPGNLHAFLGQFSARNINLTKLESRPTKRGLGDYCFVIDLEGHIASEVIADCLRDLHVQAGNVKFLGSYPAGGAQGTKRRRDASASWRAADVWVKSLRELVQPKPSKKRRRFQVVK